MNSDRTPNINDLKFEAWFRNHYLNLILGSLFVFSILPVFAPILMKLGFFFPAKLIYWIYSIFCHQFPFRSWFLFGTQAYYPLSNAGLARVISFEAIFHPRTMDFNNLKAIIGNDYAGYKVAICQRDIAMYFSLLAFGIFYSLQKRKIKKIPLWIWLIVGVIPIGFDGISQYLGKVHIPFLGYVVRESTPFLRTITGSLFGLFTGWYIFPAFDAIISRSKTSITEQ